MNWLLEHPILLCLCIGLVAFLESFALLGILVPGVVLLFSLAAIANTLGVSPWLVMLAGMLGAIVGDIGSYYLGRRLKNQIGQWQWFKQHQSWLEQGEWFIQRWGWLSVIIGRFLGPLRPVIPLTAGTLGMPATQFVPLSLMTVLVWAPAYLLPGYYTGELAHLWQVQPLSNQALIKYTLTMIAIAGSSVAIYHHAHPEQKHMRSWLRKNNALHWPISSAGLTLISTTVLLALLIFQGKTANAEFLTWSLDWQQQAITPVWQFFSSLSQPPVVLLQLCLILLWLVLNKDLYLCGLTTAAFVLLTMLTQLALAVLEPFQNPAAFEEMVRFTFLVAFATLLACNGVKGLKRWPFYLAASLLMIASAVSHLWLGQLSLSATGAALFLALAVNGALRSLWRTLHIHMFAQQPAAFICLLILTSIAAGLIRV